MNELISDTKLLQYSDNIYIKLEQDNLSGSIKDRISKLLFSYLANFNYKKIVCVSSGNMAISLLMYNNYYKCGYQIIICSVNLSEFSKKILELLGAKLYIFDTLSLAISYALDLAKDNDIYYFDQFNNELSVAAYYDLSVELLKEKIDFDYIICGIGTGATLKSLTKIYGLFKPKTKFIGIKPVDKIYGLSRDLNTKIIKSLPKDTIIKEYCYLDVYNKYIEELLKYPLGFSTCASLLEALKLDCNLKILIIGTDGYHKYV